MKNKKANYSGNGASLECETGKDSYILQQMKKGKPNPIIKMDNDDEFIRFASKMKKIASKMIIGSESFSIDKKFKQVSSTSSTNYRFYLTWSLSGDFNGTSINDLNLVKELLFSRVNNDFQMLHKTLTVNLENMGEVSIDFGTSKLFCEAVVAFEVNVVTDVKRITEQLVKLGFDGGDVL